MGTATLSTIQMRHSNDGGSTAYAVVHYSYQVMGQPYHGTRVRPGPDVGGSGVRKIVERYPAGAQVIVYYNPEKQSEAVLERGTPGYINWFWIIPVITDLFLCGLGAVLLLTL